MAIYVHAIYRDGAIYPDQPLPLPDNTKITVVVTPPKELRDVTPSIRPPAPRISSEELEERLRRHAIRVGSLPINFSREDINQDHD
jgi:hypothetical protein